jgi:crotonobetaine/carnitine-CoA ligase
MTAETLPASMPPAQRTLPAMLQRQAARFGPKAFLQLGDVRWSHAQAVQLAATRAAALANAGVQQGDRVALMSSNRGEFLELFLACGWLGAVVVPINTASMGPQIAYFLADSQARLLVIESAFLQRLSRPVCKATAVQEIWVLGEPDASDAADTDLADAGLRVRPYPAAGEPVPAAAVGPGDALAILYTSGTTGPAKGVVCPHAQYYWWGVHVHHLAPVSYQRPQHPGASHADRLSGGF